jgi:hypothetical protein
MGVPVRGGDDVAYSRRFSGVFVLSGGRLLELDRTNLTTLM